MTTNTAASSGQDFTFTWTSPDGAVQLSLGLKGDDATLALTGFHVDDALLPAEYALNESCVLKLPAHEMEGLLDKLSGCLPPPHSAWRCCE